MVIVRKQVGVAYLVKFATIFQSIRTGAMVYTQLQYQIIPVFVHLNG